MVSSVTSYMCDPEKLGIKEYLSNPFYTNVDKWTNVYSIEWVIYRSYSYKFDFVSTT